MIIGTGLSILPQAFRRVKDLRRVPRINNLARETTYMNFLAQIVNILSYFTHFDRL